MVVSTTRRSPWFGSESNLFIIFQRELILNSNRPIHPLRIRLKDPFVHFENDKKQQVTVLFWFYSFCNPSFVDICKTIAYAWFGVPLLCYYGLWKCSSVSLCFGTFQRPNLNRRKNDFWSWFFALDFFCAENSKNWSFEIFKKKLCLMPNRIESIERVGR